MDNFEEKVKDSVSFRSEKVPLYLCSIIGFALDTIIPAVIKGIEPNILYFVYGGRATSAYNKKIGKPSPLTSDWDILFDDRVDTNVVPRFAQYMQESLQNSIRNEFKDGPEIRVTISDKDYSNVEQKGRYEIQIVDPYLPFEKTYDCIGISGCHKINEDESENYCDESVFRDRQIVNGIYYAGPSFIQAETVKVYEKDRLRKLKLDEAELKEAIKLKDAVDKKLENGEQLDYDDINAIENFEDLVDLYLSSYAKTMRTRARLI